MCHMSHVMCNFFFSFSSSPFSEQIATKNNEPTRAVHPQPGKPNNQLAPRAELHKRLDAGGHRRFKTERATPEPSTHSDTKPSVSHQNMAAHQVLHVWVTDPYTPNAPSPPHARMFDQTPRDKKKCEPTPKNTNGNGMAKNFATTSKKLMDVETQPPKEPGPLNQDQAKLFQPIKAWLLKYVLTNIETPEAELPKLFDTKWFKLTVHKLPDAKLSEVPKAKAKTPSREIINPSRGKAEPSSNKPFKPHKVRAQAINNSTAKTLTDNPAKDLHKHQKRHPAAPIFKLSGKGSVAITLKTTEANKGYPAKEQPTKKGNKRNPNVASPTTAQELTRQERAKETRSTKHSDKRPTH